MIKHGYILSLTMESKLTGLKGLHMGFNKNKSIQPNSLSS